MTKRALPVVCVLALLAAFGIDLVTPQLFVAAILLDVPIVLSTYAGSRRLTGSLIVAALVANVVAGYVNGVQAGYMWEPIGLADRFLSALSIVMVGGLGLAVHATAQRSGAIATRERQAERERDLRRAADAIRASLSEELVERAIVREARRLLDADRAMLYVLGPAGGEWSSSFLAVRGEDEVVVGNERPGTEMQSTIARMVEDGDAAIVTSDDAIGRLVLDRMEAKLIFAAPLIERGARYGALVVVHEAAETPADAMSAERVQLRAFAEQAALALAQARLFDALAQKNEELAGRSEVIRDIVYALSHDLRTPLAAIGLTLRQAREGKYGPMPPDYQDILDRSIAANDELHRLAETLLLVARYESGETMSARDEIDLVPLAREVTSLLEPLAKQKGLTLEVAAPSGQAIVLADNGELRRALTNLIANAVTWSTQGGTVRVEVSVADGKVSLSVVDTGYGVPPAMRNALFTRFAGAQRGGASGLGLYIVRRIAEANGGTATYAPNEPTGSRFSLTLPLARPVMEHV